MQSSKHTKTRATIFINKNLTRMIKINSPTSEYSIKQNLFDPSKSSPPNDFLNKLQKRMKIYNNYKEDNIDVSLDNE